jgi:hypothetical protein
MNQFVNVMAKALALSVVLLFNGCAVVTVVDELRLLHGSCSEAHCLQEYRNQARRAQGPSEIFSSALRSRLNLALASMESFKSPTRTAMAYRMCAMSNGQTSIKGVD